MKRILFFFVLLFAVPLFAQSKAGPFTINASSSPCATIQTTGQATVGIQVTGTFSATLQPEVSIAGQTPQDVQVAPSTTGTPQATITAVGVYTAGVAGSDQFLVCVGSYASGTATVYLTTTTAISAGTIVGTGGGVSGGPFTSGFPLQGNGGNSIIQAKSPAYGFLNLPNVANQQINSGGLPTGDNDLYTVPANKRAFAVLYHFNPNLQTATDFEEVKIGGTYYKVSASTVPAFNITGTAGVWAGIVLEAGQTFSLNTALGTALALTQVAVSGGTATYTGTITNGGSNALANHSVTIAGFANTGNNVTCTALTSSTTTFTCATTTQVNETHAGTWQDQTGLNVFGTVFTFDNTAPLKSSVLTSFTAGNNTVYTCCAAGKTSAYSAGFTSVLNSSGTQIMTGFNNTGGTLVYSWNCVKSGGSVSTANQLYSQSIATNVAFGTIGCDFNSGDFASVNTSSTSGLQIAWVTVFEQ